MTIKDKEEMNTGVLEEIVIKTIINSNQGPRDLVTKISIKNTY